LGGRKEDKWRISKRSKKKWAEGIKWRQEDERRKIEKFDWEEEWKKEAEKRGGAWPYRRGKFILKDKLSCRVLNKDGRIFILNRIFSQPTFTSPRIVYSQDYNLHSHKWLQDNKFWFWYHVRVRRRVAVLSRSRIEKWCNANNNLMTIFW
jgi:hypothetical protein